MPFINGRYHVNPIMGAALEAAREAEAAMLALQNHGQHDGDDAGNSGTADSPDASAPDVSAAKAPIHHVEIEATELVPSHSGRATRGFIARIHRSTPQPSATAGSGASCAYNLAATPAPATKPETHVFSNHRDLLEFLHNELSKR